MANILDCNQKPDIKYPLFWGYKAIFLSGDDAKSLVAKILIKKEYQISPSKSSKTQKYQSYDISVLVFNEEERLLVFSELKRVAKFVL